VLTPATAFVLTPGGPQDMPPSQRESSMKDMKTNALSVVSRADDPKVTVRAGGTEKVGETEAQVLDVTADGASARWFVEASTGRVVRTVSRTLAPGGGPTEQVVDYSDFRPVDGGLTLPFKRTLTRGGQDAGSIEVKEVQVNPPVDEKDFERPAAPGN